MGFVNCFFNLKILLLLLLRLILYLSDDKEDETSKSSDDKVDLLSHAVDHLATSATTTLTDDCSVKLSEKIGGVKLSPGKLSLLRKAVPTQARGECAFYIVFYVFDIDYCDLNERKLKHHCVV